MKKQFPIFTNDKQLVYLDSAATSQKPQRVIESISAFYATSNANVHRGVYPLSAKATGLYDQSRQTVAAFINAAPEQIIFTKGTTDSINMVALGLEKKARASSRKTILLTELEHHANLVPWQQLAKKAGMQLQFIRITDSFELDYKDAQAKMTNDVFLLAFPQVSNALGTIIDVKRLVGLAHAAGSLCLIDAAQSAGHMRIDIQESGCDFLAFSGHKMYGPDGIGVLYGENLSLLEPSSFGGDMISSVSYTDATWNEIPYRFEAGTQHISGAIGLAEAIRFIQSVGFDAIQKSEHDTLSYALAQLQDIPGITLMHPTKGAAIISFTLAGAHPHDIASLLGDYGVCVRGGHHCAMPLMDKLGVQGTCRISIGIYTTKEDIDRCISALRNVVKILGVSHG